MTIFRQALPTYTPPNIAERGELAVQRERILQTILLTAAILGTIGFIFLIPGLLARPTLATLFQTTFFVGLFIVLALARRLPYTLRVLALIIPIYLASIYSLITSGPNGYAIIFLFTTGIAASLLLRTTYGIVSLVLSVVTMLAVALLRLTNVIPAPAAEQILNTASDSYWISITAVFTLFFTMLVVSLLVLFGFVETSLTKRRELTTELERERNSLRERINERTANLERRSLQVRAAAEVSRSISSILDPNAVLQTVVNLIVERFNLYYVGAFMLDERKQNAVLRAGTGEAGQKMIENRHSLAVGGSSMIGQSIANREAKVALDIGEAPVRFNNPYLPNTHSEIALPLISRGQILGALTIQSARVNDFDQDDLVILQGIADSLSIALENATLYQQTRQNLDEIRTLNRQFLQQAWSDTAETHGRMNYSYDNPSLRQLEADSIPNTIELPLILRDSVIGQMTLEMDNRTLSADETALVESIITQTALALENARLIEDTRRKATQEQTINQLTAEFSRALSVDEVLKTALRELSHLPSVTEVSVHLLPPDALKAKSIEPGGNGHAQEGAK